MIQTTTIARRIVTKSECIAALASRSAARNTKPAKRRTTTAARASLKLDAGRTGGA